jgi:hypothetical protein
MLKGVQVDAMCPSNNQASGYSSVAVQTLVELDLPRMGRIYDSKYHSRPSLIVQMLREAS